MKIELNGSNALKTYQEKILTRFSGDIVPPVNIIRKNSCDSLNYVLDGMRPLTETGFDDLSDLFFVLRTLLLRYRKARNYFLGHGSFLPDAEHTYILMESGEAFPVFGGHATPDQETRISEHILPVIKELGSRHRVPGASGAFEKLEKKVRTLSPGLSKISDLTEETEREWNCILPPTP